MVDAILFSEYQKQYLQKQPTSPMHLAHTHTLQKRPYYFNILIFNIANSGFTNKWEIFTSGSVSGCNFMFSSFCLSSNHVSSHILCYSLCALLWPPTILYLVVFLIGVLN